MQIADYIKSDADRPLRPRPFRSPYGRLQAAATVNATPLLKALASALRRKAGFRFSPGNLTFARAPSTKMPAGA